MANQRTRRSILQSSLRGSLLAFGSANWVWTRSVESVWAEVHGQSRTDGNTESDSMLSTQQRNHLAAIANEIIPAEGERPSAVEAGAVDYIQVVLKDVPELRNQLTDALDRLNRTSQSMYQADLSGLGSTQLVELLKAFEKETQNAPRDEELAEAPMTVDLFAILRDLIYEAYYTNPEIWNRLGYSFRTTTEGSSMKAFDESILAKVRQLPKQYREVP